MSQMNPKDVFHNTAFNYLSHETMKFLITLFIKRERSVRNMIYLYSLRSGVNISIPRFISPPQLQASTLHLLIHLSIYPSIRVLSIYLSIFHKPPFRFWERGAFYWLVLRFIPRIPWSVGGAKERGQGRWIGGWGLGKGNTIVML